MSEQLESKKPNAGPPPMGDPRNELGWFVAFVVLLNVGFLVVSIADIYPRDRPGIHNLLAIPIAVLVSPIVNGIFILKGVAKAGDLHAACGYPKGRSLAMAVLVPLAGIIVNLGTVLLMVPWDGGSGAWR